MEDVILQVGKLIGKEQAEVWRAIRDGILKIDYGPRWNNGNETDEMTVTFTLGKVV